MIRTVSLISLCFLGSTLLRAERLYYDRTHASKVFGQKRNFRIFLPRNYEQSTKHYPVVYYFHGHSDRYTLEHYDNGLDTVPKIAGFVQGHDLIVVAVDGYVAEAYSGFYGGYPYDVRRDGGSIDFGEYFLELVSYVDSQYRTLTSRRFRATAGLSMGGFMSLYLSARYPDLIGSASAFNPGPEFYVGEKGRRSLWRPKDHVLNHQHTMIRLVRASGDYISQYHEETREAYARTPEVDFEFRQDEYHRHWATSIAETLDFHLRAFANAGLDTRPTDWSYTSAYGRFKVWGYEIASQSAEPSLISLERVSQDGFRLRSKRWAPDGPAGGCTAVRLSTAPFYKTGATYAVADLNLASGKVSTTEVKADEEGRLQLELDCAGHQVSFSGPGASPVAPVLLPPVSNRVFTALPGKEISIPVKVYNPGSVPLHNLWVEVRSDYPTVEIVQGKAGRTALGAHELVDFGSEFKLRFTAGDGGFARTRLLLNATYEDGASVSSPFDVMVAPDHLAAPAEVVVVDGRSHTFAVFRQRGNQGGGSRIERTVHEGTGNGNGVLEPGERATIWLRLHQGVDPFDKENWCRAKVYSDSEWLTEVSDIQEDKGREWTGAQNRTSLVELSRRVSRETEVPMILDCESWSFQFTPDVRYGKEALYQAFQIHRHHVFAWTWKADRHKSLAGETQ